MNSLVRLPSRRQRVRAWRDLPNDLVEHARGRSLANPEVLGAIYPDDLDVWDERDALARRIRLQLGVVLCD